MKDRKQIAIDLFNEYAALTDAEMYFSDDELKESKATFINDLLQGHKQHYIDHINESIEEIKPAGPHGVYDFELIREYEAIRDKIINF